LRADAPTQLTKTWKEISLLHPVAVALDRTSAVIPRGADVRNWDPTFFRTPIILEPKAYTGINLTELRRLALWLERNLMIFCTIFRSKWRVLDLFNWGYDSKHIECKIFYVLNMR